MSRRVVRWLKQSGLCIKVAVFVLTFHLLLLFVLSRLEMTGAREQKVPSLQINASSSSSMELANLQKEEKARFFFPLLPSAQQRSIYKVQIEDFFEVASQKNPEVKSFWWRQLPAPLSMKRDWNEGLAQVVWRGAIESYIAQEKPLKMRREWSELSARTLRYQLYVDTHHGRLMSLQPLDDEGSAEFRLAVRQWLWQQPFLKRPFGGVVIGEVELCFGGEDVEESWSY